VSFAISGFVLCSFQVYPVAFFSYISPSAAVILLASLALIIRFPLPYNKAGRASAEYTRVGTLIVATIYLQLIQNRYMFRSFTVL